MKDIETFRNKWTQSNISQFDNKINVKEKGALSFYNTFLFQLRMLSWVLYLFSTQLHSDLLNLRIYFHPLNLLWKAAEFIIFAIISKFTRNIDVCSFVVRMFQEEFISFLPRNCISNFSRCKLKHKYTCYDSPSGTLKIYRKQELLWNMMLTHFS